MASDQHQCKRPRLSAASALSKPFRSPLRTRDADASPRSPSSASDIITTPKDGSESASSPTASNAETDPFVSSRGMSLTHRPTSVPKLPVTKRSPLADPELLDLQKQQRILQSRLAKLRTELDDTRQALRIESTSKDAELEALIVKWRLVSQEAADEVFAGAQERVTKMGGLVAWRERSKQDAARWAFDDEETMPEDEDDLEHTIPDENVRRDQDGRTQQIEEAQDEARPFPLLVI